MLYYALYVSPSDNPLPRSVIQQPEIGRYVEGWGRLHDQGVIAVNGNVGLGAAWLRLLTGIRAGFGYVDDQTPELSIALLPEYRRQGIGTQMLSSLFETARLHFPAVCLSVHVNNPARRLYQRFGFEIVAVKGESLTMLKHFQEIL
jgi:ribosomal protein S18 acetylase RimI-like enzyme